MSLQHYIDAFSTLRMNRSGGAVSPHKVCLLLAVMDQALHEIKRVLKPGGSAEFLQPHRVDLLVSLVI